MTTLSTPTAAAGTSQDRRARLVCAAAAAATAVPFALSSFSGDSGAEITASLVDDAMPITLGSIVAVLVSAGLFLAAVRLAAVVTGAAGRVVATAGAAVAMMYALYYSSFGAGAIVAAQCSPSRARAWARPPP